MNKIELIGRLTKDPEIKYGDGDSQKSTARYTLAVDRKYKKDGEEQSADFIRCVTFGKMAEFAGQYFHKGMKVAVTGRIQTWNYPDQNGQTVYVTDVVVEEQEFAESKAASQSAQSGGQKNSAANTSRDADGFMNIGDDLPFQFR